MRRDQINTKIPSELLSGSRDMTVVIRPLFGVIYSLLLSLLAVWLWDSDRPLFVKLIGIFLLLPASRYDDWASPVESIRELGVYMVPLLIGLCYNGQSGSKHPIHKWFFYIFYPLHLILLALPSYGPPPWDWV